MWPDAGGARSARLFGGYGGAKGIGYLAGPVAGGVMVNVGGYSLLFIVLATLAAAVALIAARTLPAVAPKRRARSTILALARQVTHPSFVQPVLILAAGTAALSAAVGDLPVLGTRYHLTPLATRALVSLLATTAALIQPWAGRAHDRSLLAAILIGPGIAISTPLGFAGLADAASQGRVGQTMEPAKSAARCSATPEDPSSSEPSAPSASARGWWPSPPPEPAPYPAGDSPDRPAIPTTP